MGIRLKLCKYTRLNDGTRDVSLPSTCFTQTRFTKWNGDKTNLHETVVGITYCVCLGITGYLRPKFQYCLLNARRSFDFLANHPRPCPTRTTRVDEFRLKKRLRTPRTNCDKRTGNAANVRPHYRFDSTRLATKSERSSWLKSNLRKSRFYTKFGATGA